MSIDPLRRWARRNLSPRMRENAERWVAEARRLRPIRRFAFAQTPSSPVPSPYPFPVAPDNPLADLGARYQPTKRLHNYLPYYWMHFRDIRDHVTRVLEIGVQTDRSIRMWEEFFPNATIFGLDIDPACERFSGDRRRVLVGDQGDPACLQRAVDAAGGAFDIVIDDGSHRVEHQLASFEFLFPRLSDHGIYVMEDTGGCVGDPGLATVRSLGTLVESILYWPRGLPAADWPHLHAFPESASWRDRNTIGLAVYRWLVFVFRGHNPGDNPHLAPKQESGA